MIIRELVTKFGFKVDLGKLRAVDKRLERIKQTTNAATGNLKNVAAGVRNIGLGLTAGLTLPIALLGASMVKAASDAEESGQKFDVVFRELSADANKTAETFAKDFGLAGSTAKELLGNTGDLASGFGFTSEKALKLAERTQRLAGDLASFQNIQGGVAEAGFKLTKGILGETENLKSLGIVVNQGTKEFKIRTKELMASMHLTEQQAKVENILEQAFKQSKNAIGDFARTQDSTANRMKIFTERIKDLQEKFGALLLPVVNKVTAALIKVANFLGGLPKPIKVVILVLGGLLAILGPILLIFGLLAQATLAMITLLPILTALLATAGGVTGILATAMHLLLSPITLIIAAIALISIGIGLLIQDFLVWMRGGESAIGKILGDFTHFKEFVVNNLKEIGAVFVDFWDKITDGFKKMWEVVVDITPDWLKNIIGFKKSDVGGGGAADRGDQRFNPKFFSDKDAIPEPAKKMADFIARDDTPAARGDQRFNPNFFGGGVDPGTNTNIEVKSNITLQLPEGTTEQQKKILNTDARKMVKEELSNQFTGAIMANPRNEN